MPRRSNDFQRLIYLIQRALADGCEVLESEELIDRVSGKSREVDLVIRSKAGPHPFVVGVECAGRKRRATIEWVEQQAAKHQNLTDKLVLVSARGFTRDAAAEAHRRGIETHTLSAILKGSSELVKNTFTLRLTAMKIEVWDWVFEATTPRAISIHTAIRAPDGSVFGTAVSHWMQVRESSHFSALVERQTSGKPLEMRYRFEFPYGSFAVLDSGEKAYIRSLTVHVNVEREVTEAPLAETTFAGHEVRHATAGSSLEVCTVVVTKPDGKISLITEPTGKGTFDPPPPSAWK